jgi:hypothetical protein
MSRIAVPLVASDLSQFARAFGRALSQRLAERPEPPSHVELLNLLARAAGHRNVQSLRAAALHVPRLAAERPAPPPLTPAARKALSHFDTQGRLLRWPTKLSVQRLAMWVLWTGFEAKRTYTEREVNEILKRMHTFGDHATLRRELVNHGLLWRKSDCSQYRKVAARADPEAHGLLNAWRAAMREARVVR